MNSARSLLRSISSLVVWETRVCYKAVWRDLAGIVMSGFVYSIFAAMRLQYSFLDYLTLLPISFVYFILHIYLFNLYNQVNGAEQDKIDKPDRPIPSGMITVQGAKYRLYLLTALYTLSGVAIGNMWSTLLWLFFTVTYNFGSWDNHWFTKNCISMPLATASTGWAAWSMVNGHPWMDKGAVLTNIVVSSYIGLTMHIQDLRDVEGDQKFGRKTLPIVYGITAAKIIVSILFFLVPLIPYFAVSSQLTVFQVVCYIAGVLVHLYVALHLLLLDKTSSDLHYTYQMYHRTLPFTVIGIALFFEDIL